ncbi:HD domain-containing protein [Paraconexibacter antarcticus]|uniref:HD domain-containing protein n=1 Tax=Paraconexibacter antarcticus TaxID=2949664 RepID=A0ABY5DQ75_9ACTN|nr:HD domain-containing phosphohydrolase [Paraconexibacter antarcticus]UTI64176.1 HD domain-containing protein [Paraconexibacter antarcticus]
MAEAAAQHLEAELAALRAELAAARADLAAQHALADDKEQQLERYAADLRETFKSERARSTELRESYVATVRALANAVEARDAYTGQHAERVSAYGLAIARTAGLRLADDPQAEFGFLLHDIGKVAVPDAVLFKPEPLNAAERTLMEQHPLVGWEILRDVGFLGEAKDVVRSHHERWDGRGYPDGLAGEAIPVAARIFAVADTLDALTTDRPYRPGRSLPEARAIIADATGTQFDPAAAAAFAATDDAVLAEIAARHR